MQSSETDELEMLAIRLVTDATKPLNPPKAKEVESRILDHINRFYLPKQRVVEAIGADEPEIVVREISEGSRIVQVNPRNQLRASIREALGLAENGLTPEGYVKPEIARLIADNIDELVEPPAEEKPE